MTDVREALADRARSLLLVVGAALVLLGAVGPGPVGPVAVVGIVILLAAFLLDEPVASLLRRDGDAERAAGDPVSDLRERYVHGELDEEEFERRVERELDPGATGTSDRDSRVSGGETGVLAESASPSEPPGRD